MMMLPAVQPFWLQPAEALFPEAVRMKNSTVKSEAPTSTGVAGASSEIFTRSTSPEELPPKKRNDDALPGIAITAASTAIARTPAGTCRFTRGFYAAAAAWRNRRAGATRRSVVDRLEHRRVAITAIGQVLFEDARTQTRRESLGLQFARGDPQ